ncbi:MAG: Rid family hydrolase [Candidatus Dormibacteraeota bacterium]|nr:Rid family hydrolase [Candidatus Dormibacteraeota bacterium]
MRKAVRVPSQGLVEISGLAPYDEHGQEVPGDLLHQTRYVLGLMEQILGEAGVGFGNVARLSVFTTAIAEWPAVWREVKSTVGTAAAMTVVEISSLVGKVAKVELEITASVPLSTEGNNDSQEVGMASSAQSRTKGGAVAIVPKSLADRDWSFHAAAFLMGKGDLVFLSGIGPVDQAGKTVGRGDPGAQTRQIISTMDTILREAGGSLDDIVRVRVFATDMANRPAINAERARAFKEPRPVSTFVQVSGLEDPDWLVELEATAFIPRQRN